MNMDDLYANLFGSKPKKRGTGYELITAAVLQHLNKRASVTHNVFLKSTFSEGTHQSDAFVEVDQKSVFVEAKDHTEQGVKTGRPEVAKLAGSLLILKDIDGAILASATDFTDPAVQFSEDLKKANATPIDLYVVRPAREEDEDGTIRKIDVKLHIISPNYADSKWEPAFKPEGREIFKDMGLGEGDKINMRIDGFYREDGNLIESIFNLTGKISHDDKTMVAKGTWEFDEDTFIYIGKVLVPIFHLNYEIPYVSHLKELEIEAGEPAVFVQAMDGSYNNLVSVEDLKTAHAGVIKGRM